MSRFFPPAPIEPGTLDPVEVNNIFDAFADAINNSAQATPGQALDEENILPATIPPNAMVAYRGLFCFPVVLEYNIVASGGVNYAGHGGNGRATTFFLGVAPQQLRIVGWSATVFSLFAGPGQPTLSLRDDGVEVASTVLTAGTPFVDAALSIAVAKDSVLTLRVTNGALATAHFVRGRAYLFAVAEGW